MIAMRQGRWGVLAMLAIAGCGAGVAKTDDLIVVGDGKADDYFSPAAQEYFVDATVPLVLDDGELGLSADAKLARARQLVSLRNVEVGWFLHVRLIDKEAKTSPTDTHGDANALTYPGFHAIVRDGDYTTSDVVPLADGKTFTYQLRLQVAGEVDLLDALPTTAGADGKRHFTLEMGKVSNTDLARLDPDHEWFRDPQWDSSTFDPTMMPADQLETLDLAFSPQPVSDDAFLDTNALLSDGALTIDVHYGWDYWDRYDISNARDLYDSLTARGFASPAASFETYAGSQGPLTKTTTLGGRDVAIAVRIFHGSGNGTVGPDPETVDGARTEEQQVYDSLASSDVIVWAGHSGNYYGFSLSDWNTTGDVGSLEYPALSAAKMPADRYQIVVATGCDTFSIGQAFRDNTSKPGLKNLDVITSNSFSNAGANTSLNALLGALFEHTDATGAFAPEPVSAMLDAMNMGQQAGSMFGLHGIDDDPALHPFAALDHLGRACSADADCGGVGNHCVAADATQKLCAAECTADRGCPDGYRCRQIASQSSRQIVGHECMK